MAGKISMSECPIQGIVPKQFLTELKKKLKDYNTRHYEKITLQRYVYKALRHFTDEHLQGNENEQ